MAGPGAILTITNAKYVSSLFKLHAISSSGWTRLSCATLAREFCKAVSFLALLSKLPKASQDLPIPKHPQCSLPVSFDRLPLCIHKRRVIKMLMPATFDTHRSTTVANPARIHQGPARRNAASLVTSTTCTCGESKNALARRPYHAAADSQDCAY